MPTVGFTPAIDTIDGRGVRLCRYIPFVISGRHGEAGEELAHFVLRTTRIADGTCRFGGRPYEAGYIPGSGMTSMISIHAPGICR